MLDGNEAHSLDVAEAGSAVQNAAARRLVVWRASIRKQPAARRIAQAWRRLVAEAGCSQGTTIVAFSGGADSTALLLALWAAAGGREMRGHRVVAMHVMHDLRSRAEVMADRDACAELCERLGVPLTVGEVSVRGAGGGAGGRGGTARMGNAEGAARSLRYAALAAHARACEQDGSRACVVTGHHVQDQLETVLLAMLRGAASRGLAGIAPRTRMRDGTVLLRPCLEVKPAALRQLCQRAGVSWVEDASNGDTSLRRNRLRARVIPELLAIKPDVAERSLTASVFLRASDRALRREARRLDDLAREGTHGPGLMRWTRAALQASTPAVVATLLRRAARQMGERRQLPARVWLHAAAVIGASDRAPKRLELGVLSLMVRRGEVRLMRADGAE
ncbi:MAG: tRNA lysidine(34) synthetase TilS [Phycisphaerales bacterium]|jgi:tRNA(Ile)-lysidine synthase|nr:tRNA lysidine(34) synthetase TilS [Phycisphaerales bacterium]